MVKINDNLVFLEKEDLTSVIRNEINRAFSHFEEQLSKKKNKIYLTRKQTKEKCNCSFPTLWKLDKEGKLKAKRFGSKVLYDQEEVERFLEGSNR